MSIAALLRSIQRRAKGGRSQVGDGIGLASDYQASVHLRNDTPESRAARLKKGSRVLVYRDEMSLLVGGIRNKPHLDGRASAGGKAAGGLRLKRQGGTRLQGKRVAADDGNEFGRLTKRIEPTPLAVMDFVGVLSSERQDRDKDVLAVDGLDVDPKMPLLWQHLPEEPVGKLVEDLGVGSDGLYRCHCAVADTKLGNDAAILAEFGALRLSHGFTPLEYEPLDDEEDGGWLIHRAHVMEVSLVSIPSNIDAGLEQWSRHKLKHHATRSYYKGLWEVRRKSVKGGFERPTGTDIDCFAPDEDDTHDSAARAVRGEKLAARLSAPAPVNVTVNIGDDILGKKAKGKAKKEEAAEDDDDEEEEEEEEEPEGEKGDEEDEDDEDEPEDSDEEPDEEEAEKKAATLKELARKLNKLAKMRKMPEEGAQRIGIIASMVGDISAKMDDYVKQLSKANTAKDLAACFAKADETLGAVVEKLKAAQDEMQRVCRMKGLPDDAPAGLEEVGKALKELGDALDAMKTGGTDTQPSPMDGSSEVGMRGAKAPSRWIAEQDGGEWYVVDSLGREPDNGPMDRASAEAQAANWNEIEASQPEGYNDRPALPGRSAGGGWRKSRPAATKAFCRVVEQADGTFVVVANDTGEQLGGVYSTFDSAVKACDYTNDQAESGVAMDLDDDSTWDRSGRGFWRKSERPVVAQQAPPTWLVVGSDGLPLGTFDSESEANRQADRMNEVSLAWDPPVVYTAEPQPEQWMVFDPVANAGYRERYDSQAEAQAAADSINESYAADEAAHGGFGSYRNSPVTHKKGGGPYIVEQDPEGYFNLLDGDGEWVDNFETEEEAWAEADRRNEEDEAGGDKEGDPDSDDPDDDDAPKGEDDEEKDDGVADGDMVEKEGQEGPRMVEEEGTGRITVLNQFGEAAGTFEAAEAELAVKLLDRLIREWEPDGPAEPAPGTGEVEKAKADLSVEERDGMFWVYDRVEDAYAGPWETQQQAQDYIDQEGDDDWRLGHDPGRRKAADRWYPVRDQYGDWHVTDGQGDKPSQGPFTRTEAERVCAELNASDNYDPEYRRDAGPRRKGFTTYSCVCGDCFFEGTWDGPAPPEWCPQCESANLTCSEVGSTVAPDANAVPAMEGKQRCPFAFKGSWFGFVDETEETFTPHVEFDGYVYWAYTAPGRGTPFVSEADAQRFLATGEVPAAVDEASPFAGDANLGPDVGRCESCGTMFRFDANDWGISCPNCGAENWTEADAQGVYYVHRNVLPRRPMPEALHFDRRLPGVRGVLASLLKHAPRPWKTKGAWRVEREDTPAEVEWTVYLGADAYDTFDNEADAKARAAELAQEMAIVVEQIGDGIWTVYQGGDEYGEYETEEEANAAAAEIEVTIEKTQPGRWQIGHANGDVLHDEYYDPGDVAYDKEFYERDYAVTVDSEVVTEAASVWNVIGPDGGLWTSCDTEAEAQAEMAEQMAAEAEDDEKAYTARLDRWKAANAVLARIYERLPAGLTRTKEPSLDSQGYLMEGEFEDGEGYIRAEATGAYLMECRECEFYGWMPQKDGCCRCGSPNVAKVFRGSGRGDGSFTDWLGGLFSSHLPGMTRDKAARLARKFARRLKYCGPFAVVQMPDPSAPQGVAWHVIDAGGEVFDIFWRPDDANLAVEALNAIGYPCKGRKTLTDDGSLVPPVFGPVPADQDICPACGSQVSETENYCPACEEPLPWGRTTAEPHGEPPGRRMACGRPVRKGQIPGDYVDDDGYIRANDGDFLMECLDCDALVWVPTPFATPCEECGSTNLRRYEQQGVLGAMADGLAWMFGLREAEAAGKKNVDNAAR